MAWSGGTIDNLNLWKWILDVSCQPVDVSLQFVFLNLLELVEQRHQAGGNGNHEEDDNNCHGDSEIQDEVLTCGGNDTENHEVNEWQKDDHEKCNLNFIFQPSSNSLFVESVGLLDHESTEQFKWSCYHSIDNETGENKEHA